MVRAAENPLPAAPLPPRISRCNRSARAAGRLSRAPHRSSHCAGRPAARRVSLPTDGGEIMRAATGILTLLGLSAAGIAAAGDAAGPSVFAPGIVSDADSA